MDWKLAGITFVTVFVAELGDKTQLGTMALASEGQSKLAVFLGSSAALVTSSALAVVAGGLIARSMPAGWIERIAGALFVVLGILMLIKSRQP